MVSSTPSPSLVRVIERRTPCGVKPRKGKHRRSRPEPTGLSFRKRSARPPGVSTVVEDPICDTEVQAYPEEVVWPLDVKDDIWAEYIAMDRSNQRRRTAQGLKTPGRLCPWVWGKKLSRW